MPELKAIFTGDGAKFEAEARRMVAVAKRTGNEINSAITSGGGHGAKSGAITETLVLLRELGRGNYTRVPGSLTILLQRMGLLKLVFKDSATAANMVAVAYSELSVKSAVAAQAAAAKAAASYAAAEADGFETAATIAQADADAEGAVAARANAVAMQQKAVAAGEAAAAQETGAAASVGSLGIVGAVIVGLLAGAYAAYKLTGFLVDKLSTLKFPDFHPEYIAKHLQAVNRVAEGWKEIGKEVDKALSKYNSVTEAAKRLADATKTHFEHERKISDLHKERDLARAKTPRERAAIEARYDKEEMNRRAQERQAEITAKETEAFNLEQESARKKAAADAVTKGVPSKESDGELLKKQRADAEAAQKYIDDSQTTGFGEKAMRAYNAAALSGVSGDDLDKAKRDNLAEANRRLQVYKDSVNRVAENDEKRKKGEDLTKEAGNSAADAAVIRAGAGDARAKSAQAAKDDAEDLQAKKEADAAKLEREKPKILLGQLTSLQKQGAYTSPAAVSMLDVAKKSERHLAGIDRKMDKLVSKPAGYHAGKVNHGN